MIVNVYFLIGSYVHSVKDFLKQDMNINSSSRSAYILSLIMIYMLRISAFSILIACWSSVIILNIPNDGSENHFHLSSNFAAIFQVLLISCHISIFISYVYIF